MYVQHIYIYDYIQNQKLTQIHSLVISFQALEKDLRDTFLEIQREHDAEKKELQKQINQLKGIEEAETNQNALYGAVKLKTNPLSQQSPSTPNNSYGAASPVSPRNNNNTLNMNGSANSNNPLHKMNNMNHMNNNNNNNNQRQRQQLKQELQQYSNQNGYHSQNQQPQSQRQANGSIAQKFTSIPQSVPTNQTNHYKNRTPLSYQQNQRNGYPNRRNNNHNNR